jgi:hypothetical protein
MFKSVFAILHEDADGLGLNFANERRVFVAAAQPHIGADAAEDAAEPIGPLPCRSPRANRAAACATDRPSFGFFDNTTPCVFSIKGKNSSGGAILQRCQVIGRSVSRHGDSKRRIELCDRGDDELCELDAAADEQREFLPIFKFNSSRRPAPLLSHAKCRIALRNRAPKCDRSPTSLIKKFCNEICGRKASGSFRPPGWLTYAADRSAYRRAHW